MYPYGVPGTEGGVYLDDTGRPTFVSEDVLLKARRGVPGTSRPLAGDVTLQGPAGSQDFLRQTVQQLRQGASGARRAVQETMAAAGPAISGGRGYGRAALGMGLLSGVPEAISELQAGRVTGAGAALGGGLVLGGIGTALTRSSNPLVKLAGVALPIVGGMMGAPAGAAAAAEATRQSITKEPTRGREGEYGTERARALQRAEDELSILDRSLGINTSNIMDLNRQISDQQFLDLQRMNPLIQKMKNADLIRQQALMNTQGQNYAMLGTLATAGRLAAGAQAETGATVRQALSSNPYSAANLAAPNVSFG